MIGVCADSNAQVPPALVARYGIEIVPVTIRIGDDEYLEGIDLDPDTFYARLAASPDAIAAIQPSPGQFALAYERLAERGATEILSIHTGSAVAGTTSSARLAARHSPVPVRLVDTGTAAIGVAAGCVWAAADAIARGATLDEAAALADELVPAVGNVFVTRAGAPPVRVLSLVDGQVTELGRGSTVDETVDTMARYAVNWRRNGVPARLNVVLGTGAAPAEPVARRLEDALRRADNVAEIVTVRIGPSMGVMAGPDVAAALFFPSQP